MYVLAPKRTNVSLHLLVWRILPVVSFLSPAKQCWPYRNNTEAISGTIHPEATVASPISVKLYLLHVPLP